MIFFLKRDYPRYMSSEILQVTRTSGLKYRPQISMRSSGDVKVIALFLNKCCCTVYEKIFCHRYWTVKNTIIDMCQLAIYAFFYTSLTLCCV